jgi:hypothetical protein
MSIMDWSKAPEWAKFVARDSNGIWAWYEHNPRLVGGSYYTSRGRSVGCVREEVPPILQERPV